MGSSIARAAYAEILPAYQPKLRQSQTLKIQEESQALATFVQEIADVAQYANEEWQSRPTNQRFNYCGLDEFDGRYYKCEVKNADQQCPHFTPRAAGAATRPCRSCRHHRPPLGHPVRVLEETFRRYGRRSDATLEEEIRPMVQMQAEGEYQDCVDFSGFLPRLPAFLPVCMARNSPEPTTGEPRCLVGPVVNSAARCDVWSPGANPSAAAESAQLDALVGYVRGIVSQAESASLMNPMQVGAGMRVQANAEAAVVARCLSMLGATPDHIAAVCNAFTLVFGESWDPQLSAQIEASAPRPAQPPPQSPQTRPPQTRSLQTRPPQRGTEPARPGFGAGGLQPGTPSSASRYIDAPVTPSRRVTPPTIPAQPSEPFLLEPMSIYRHPHDTIAVFINLPLIDVIRTAWDPATTGGQFGMDQANAAEPVGAWEVSSFQAGTWTQLHDDDTPLPITVNVQSPEKVYVAWYVADPNRGS